jgi:CubicO group peptidase (beta-lactamase class C family)
MNPTLLFLSFVFLISLKSISQNKNDTDLILQINAIVLKNDFNGVVLVTKSNEKIYAKAVGLSDLENEIDLKLSDQFIIGSISKQITAVLLLREYEKGTIKLEEKINEYLPELNQPWSREVTVHQLLTHTHGIVGLEQPLEFTAGSQFHYSQLGYQLLAQILEKITDKKFEKLATTLFKHYGLKNTYHPDHRSHTHLVKGYEEQADKTLQFATNSLENYVPAGAFISNAEDLNKWTRLLHSAKLVKKETLQKMMTKYATRIHPIFENVDYGYGLLFQDGEQNRQIGALGYAPGFVSACYYYPKTKMNLIVLENTARNLENFKRTFIVHTEIMAVLKKQLPD